MCESTKAPPPAQLLSLEGDCLTEVWIVLKEGEGSGIDPPINGGSGKLKTEQSKHRHGLEDISERAGLQDENLLWTRGIDAQS